MLTECPSCRTVFRVTPAILKMGHGQVRCGQCRRQFDAIECMLDEEDIEKSTPAESPKASESTPRKGASAQSFEPTSYAEEVVMEGSRIEISGTYRLPGAASSDAPDEKFVHEHVVIDRGELPPLPNIEAEPAYAIESDASQGEEMDDDGNERDADPEQILDLNDDDDEPVADAAHNLLDEPDEGEQEQEFRGVIEAPPVPKRWRRTLAGVGRRREHAEIHAELNALTERTTPRVLRTGVWTAIFVLFLVALLVQIVHHNRDALVRDPRFGNTVSRAYRLFGLSPTPHWDLAAYKWDIYKVSLDPKIPEALRVTGSVANDAPFAQPYPLGKLSLQDRWGGAVGARAFEPYEYLATPEAADRLMAPKQRANIEIVIADPGADAVGYLIHACVEQDKHLACSDQLPVFK